MGPLRVIAVLLATAVSALLVADLIFAGLFYLAPGGTPSLLCDDQRNCTLDVRYADNTCGHRDYSRNVACQDACYVYDSTTTMCDSMGACIGNLSECRGTCTPDNDDANGYCQQAIPLDIDFWYAEWEAPYTDAGQVEYIFDWGYSCEYGQCGAYALAVQVSNGYKPSLMATGGIGDDDSCLTYMNQTFMRNNGGAQCIQAQRFPLDSFIVSDLIDDGTAFQMVMCMYHYRCSRINYDMIMDAYVNAVQPAGSMATSLGSLSISSAGVATLTAPNVSAAGSLASKAAFINASRHRVRSPAPA